MNWTSQPATESQPVHLGEVGHAAQTPQAPPQPKPSSRPQRDILIGKKRVPAQENGKETEIEVFTVSMGNETIELLPFKNWAQLDVYKWVVRGKLPGTPSGLEVASGHVKMLGETVSVAEPDGCSKLETLFNEWLSLEKENLELARKKDQAKPRSAAQTSGGQPEAASPHFRVERGANGQVHIHRFYGKEILSEIGLNAPGFSGLFSSGLMRKPKKMQIGVMHDWIELDGEVFSFAKGNNDSAKLEKALNERYLPDASLGRGKDVLVFANAASSTGFDIQFPVTKAGVTDNRKRPLVEETLALLQDFEACGVLHKEIVIKLTRPNFVFKKRTADGGERYLERSPENTLTVTADDGSQKVIDLSQPVNYMRLTPIELTAVFNHPAINRHSQAAPETPPQAAGAVKPATPPPPAREPAGAGASAASPPPLAPPPETPAQKPSQPPSPEVQPARNEQRRSESLPTPPAVQASSATQALASAPGATAPEVAGQPVHAETSAPPSAPKEPQEKPPGQGVVAVAAAKPSPNAWLENVLAQPPIRHDWLACMVYSKLAERFGNSHDGVLGLSRCWAVALDETEDIADPAFKGVYLTEKHGIGFLCQGRIARFNQGVAFIGTQESAIQGIGVSLIGVGLDAQDRIVFVISDGYRKKFGVPDQTVEQEFERLEKYGAVILGAKEALNSQLPIEVLWTVPLAQENPADPQAIESVRPAGEAKELGRDH